MPVRILDRYVLRNFFTPLALCLLGFLCVMLIFDLNDNGQDFIGAGLPMDRILLFYVMQLPYLIMITLPVGMLLALLYSITRMSRNNEILAMLGAGISVQRLILPLLGAGLCGTAALTWLNYELAPHADGIRDKALEMVVRGTMDEKVTVGHLFRDRVNRRIWFVEELPEHLRRLNGIQVIQQDEAGLITRKHYAKSAVHDDITGQWQLSDAKVVDFNPAGDVINTEYHGTLVVKEWKESPWRIASSTMQAKTLSVPELAQYLVENADFPANLLAAFKTNYWHRWALPWNCVIVILVGAPLALTFSRRGVLGSIAAALVLFFAMIFLDRLFLALGEGSRIDPFAAAWTPTLVFFGIGSYLLWLRSTNREGFLPWG